MGKQLGVRVSEELYGRVEAARGDVPRARWVERALEAALEPVKTNRPVDNPYLSAEAREVLGSASANFGAVNRSTPSRVAEAAGLNQFKCGCATSATSVTARCPKHGRSLKV